MRKLFFFLLVFALGLALLLWLDRYTSPPVEPAEPAPVPVRPGLPEPQEPTVVDTPQGQTVVATGGVFEHTERHEETLLPSYRIRARDHRSIGEGVFELDDVEAWFFDDDGERERVIEARRAQGRVQVSPEVRFDEQRPVELREVVVRQLTGTPLAPLILEVARLQARLADERAWSQDEVVLNGRGLKASGTGLEIDKGGRSLSILRDPRVVLELANGRARLQANGPLRVRSRPDLGEDVVEISAEESALLELFESDESTAPVQLWAESVVLEATRGEGLERFEPRRARARGRVKLAPGEGTFTSESLELDFDAQGKPSRAVLAEAPRVELLLREIGEDIDLEVPSEGVRVLVSGEGPLTVLLYEPESFTFTGPLLVEAPEIGATLTAREELSGVREEHGFSALSASGTVVVAHPRGTLRTERLLVTSTPGPDERPALTLQAEGRTLVEGALEDGRGFTLRAREHLLAVHDGERVHVPEARGVEISVQGKGGFVAGAERVRDFRPDPLTLLAQGNVTYNGELGAAQGERLTVLGPEHVVLEGDDEHRAVLDLLQGTVTADRLGWRGEEFSAEGAVEALGKVDDLQIKLFSEWLTVLRELAPLAQGQAEEAPRAGTYTLQAGGEVRLRARGPAVVHELDAKSLRVIVHTPTGAPKDLELRLLLAEGAVQLRTEGPEASVRGRGETLVVEQDRSGSLKPLPGERVELEGLLPKSELTFRMTAAELSQRDGRIEALLADLEVIGLDLPPVSGEPPGEEPVHARASAGRITLDQDAIVLSEGASLARLFEADASWTLDSERVQIGLVRKELPPDAELEEQLRKTRVSGILASGGFFAQSGELRLRGEELELVQPSRRLTARGAPAQLLFQDLTWEMPWIEIDPSTGSLRAASGTVRTLPLVAGEEPLVLRYDSIETVAGPDETIQVLREPVVTSGTRELRASWALFWLDARQWSRMTSGMVTTPGQVTETPNQAAPGVRRRHPKSLFADLDPLGEWLREAYLEGDVEVYEEGERRVRADAFYIDMVDGHGWIRKLDLWVELPFTSRERFIKLRAEWLRASGDGTYHADTVVATSCEFEDPHYVLRIGDVTVTPRTKVRPRRAGDRFKPGDSPELFEEHEGWNFNSRRSSIVFKNNVALPLPRVSLPTDPNFGLTEGIGIGGLTLPKVSLGRTSKFGSFISTSLNLGFWRPMWAWLHLSLGGRADLEDLEGDTSLRAHWLGSRGVMLGLENRLFGENYWLDLDVDGLYDSGRDRGLLRVDDDDRSDVRAWLRSRGRYSLGDGEWLDLSLTWQSDPGVQAEFFEREYLRFEQRESWLQWRRARGQQYWSVLAETQLDDHTSAVLEQPSLTHAFGNARVARLGKLALSYSSRTQVGRFLWREGDPQYPSPFDTSLGLPGPGTEEREILRAHTEQRFELPVALGIAGLRAVPFVSGLATVWDEGLDEADSPGRATLLAGLELSTTLWRQFADASRHEWTPTVGVRTDLAHSEDGGAPFVLDRTELPVRGTFVDVGVRSRWSHPELNSFLDAEVRETFAADRPDGSDDEWLPLYVRGSWLASVLGVPYGLYHDARYDLETEQTLYSRTLAGLEPIPPLELEAGYHSARDLAGERLYTAYSVGARYLLSPKWELEGRQTVSASGEGRLSSDLLVRRIGHDFVFDLELSFIAGEGGGESLSFRIEPLLFWRRPGLGLLDRWRTGGN